MIRALVLTLVALFSLAAGAVRAEPGTAGWIKVATTTISATTGGSKTIDLPDVAFRALRLTADKSVVVKSLKGSVGGNQVMLPSFSLTSGTPSASYFTSAQPKSLKQIELSWDAQPNAGMVRLEIWALTGQETAQESAKEKSATIGQASPNAGVGGSSIDDTTASPRRAAPRPSAVAPSFGTSAPSSATRGIGASPPPPPAPAAAQPAQRSVAKKTDAPPADSASSRVESKPAVPPVVASVETKPTPCAETAGSKPCTMVDVFFGTDRNQVPNPERVSFGAERFGKLQLGHAFVTVPNAKRKRGAIPLPGAMERMLGLVPPGGDPARHFTIPKGGVIVYATEDEFIAAAKAHAANAGAYKDHAFIFVHGFSVSFENALYRTAQITYDLSTDGTPFGTAFMYSWPSAGDISSYLTDQDSSRLAIKHLTKYIRMVVDKTGVKNVHLIAHSMGNVALVGALQEIARTEDKAIINQVILAAPDIDKQEFESIVTDVGKVAKGITLYASQGDRALYASRKVHGGLPRAGETVVPPGPAVAKGVDTIDVTKVSTDAFWGHDIYADSSEVLADIAMVFIKGEPPPKRSPKFRFGAMKYWIYDK